MARKKPDEAAINNKRLISEARSKFYVACADGVPSEAAAADASRFYRDALSSGAALPKPAAMVEFARNLSEAPIPFVDPGKMPAPPNMGEAHPFDAVEIPADIEAFRALTWPQRKSIASKISETPIKAIPDAEAAYLAEVERRAQ